MICNENKEKMNLQINDTNSVRKHASTQSFSLCIKLNLTYIKYISGLRTQQFKIKKSALNYSYEHIYCLLKKIDIKNIPRKTINYNKCYDQNCFFCDSVIVGLCETCFKVNLVALVLEFDNNKLKIVLQKQYEYYIFIMEKFLQYFWYIIENRELVKGDLHNKLCFFHWYENQILSYRQITFYVLRLYFYIEIKNKFDIINNLLNINDFEKLMRLKKDLSHDTLNDNANTSLSANFKGLENHLCQIIGFFYLPLWLMEKYKEIMDFKTSNFDSRFSSDIKILDVKFLFLIKDLTLNTQNEIVITDKFDFNWNNSLTNITSISSFFGLLGCYDKELRVYSEADSYLKFCEWYLIDGKLFTDLANKYVKNLFNTSNRQQYVASLDRCLLDDPYFFSKIFANYIQEILNRRNSIVNGELDLK
ncbi:hypothetical protein COBT_000327 [Conglomerata obtusa]